MSHLKIAVAFLFYVMFRKASADCPDDWVVHGNSCYSFIGIKKTWTEANVICESEGAYIAQVETADENDFIKGYLKQFGDLGASVSTWLGANDLAIEGVWRWEPSGSEVQYADWNPGEPGGDGDCLVMYQSHNYHWDDIKCSSRLTVMCEKPKSTTLILG